jgi:hypothetical protein
MPAEVDEEARWFVESKLLVKAWALLPCGYLPSGVRLDCRENAGTREPGSSSQDQRQAPLFSSVSHVDIATGMDRPQLPEEPTQYRPGSQEKLELLAERARLGLPLDVPGDFVLPRENDGQTLLPPPPRRRRKRRKA